MNKTQLFRIGLGAYLALHFLQLAPWAIELFSNQGALPQGSASPLLTLFPNVLAVWDGPVMVSAFIATAIALTVPLMLGKGDRAAALGLFYVWACLLGRNPLILNPGLPYVGWLLLAHGLTAKGEGGVKIRAQLFWVAWVLTAVGYSYSGAYKLLSPSWQDGSALLEVLNNPLARDHMLRDLIAGLPEAVLKVGTWFVLGLEVLFAPLALSRHARPVLWLVMTGMHVGLLFVVDFADLTFGMLILHLYIFDPQWLSLFRTTAAGNKTAATGGRAGSVFQMGGGGSDA